MENPELPFDESDPFAETEMVKPSPDSDASETEPHASATIPSARPFDADSAQPSPRDHTANLASAAETEPHGGEPVPEGEASADRLTGHRLLDRYVVGQKLGSGGFGTVYQAHDELMLSGGEDAEIAIKVLERNKIGNRINDGLIQEVGKSKKVTHPNILRVHDAHIDGGLAFITMELLRGQTLKQRIAEVKLAAQAGETFLPIREIDDLSEQVCDALDYCHDQSLVHADIKPENIFLCDDGVVKLLDLGISQIIGTPGRIRGYSALYGSPQQSSGESPHPTDDIFSLGCVLYECLTGEPAQERPSSNSGAETLLKPDVSELPRRYRRAIAEALELDREDREDSASALWHRISPDIRRRNVLLAVLAVVAVAGFISAGWLGMIIEDDPIPVTQEDQQAAQTLYLQAMNYDLSDPGRARQLLVEVLEKNPYHDEAAGSIAEKLSDANYLEPTKYSAIWADFAAALDLAPTSESLTGTAKELTDALLEVEPQGLGLSRSATVSRYTSPLCVLPKAGHRVEELNQRRADLKISC